MSYFEGVARLICAYVLHNTGHARTHTHRHRELNQNTKFTFRLENWECRLLLSFEQLHTMMLLHWILLFRWNERTNEHDFARAQHCRVFDVVYLQITWWRTRDINRIYWKFAIIWLTMAQHSLQFKHHFPASTINSANNYFAISATELDMKRECLHDKRNIFSLLQLLPYRSHIISSE